MASLSGQLARVFLFMVLATAGGVLFASGAHAAPYAAIVTDARSGETLYETNADTRLHPASLTKMLTLYITFDAIRRGEVSLDTMITVSKNAASQPPSRLGLKAGQRIALRHLIRAAAVKSANDAAAAIGDGLAGSQSAFADRMNRTAKMIGMKNSTFKNANGLTATGHLSTARDMNHLGRRLFYDFPEYYNIFSRRTTDAGVAQVSNTNRRFLDSYEGADGIKTGYTNAAGFNLTASAERGNKRIIATVFGGTSTAQRNVKMASLLDLGFKSAATNVAVRKPAPANLPDADTEIVVASDSSAQQGNGDGRSAGKTIRLVTSLKSSPRPRARPGAHTNPDPAQAHAAAAVVMAMQDSITGALEQATGTATAAPAPTPVVASAEQVPDLRPAPRPETETLPFAVAEAPPETESLPFKVVAALPDAPPFKVVAGLPEAAQSPTDAQADMIVALSAPAPARPAAAAAPATPQPAKIRKPKPAPVPSEPEVITRISTSGGRHWGVNLGRFASKATADRMLMKIALSESATLQDGLRKIVPRNSGYDANFMGLTQAEADLACRRLQARAVQCFTIGP
ncbi:MAG: D-alanyl-D-alanine carboxypeptidase family protein [Paracoccaceae bacterium]|nr:D-alanyl-D-alanine carboxypeptidase family protein [Paracoccaceae bacterium]